MLETIAQFFSQGGNFMWIIMFILAAAVAVIIERVYFYFVVYTIDADQLVAQLSKLLNQNDPDAALELVSKKKTPLEILLYTAIQRYRDGFSYKDIEQAVEEVAIKELPKIPQRINYLAMFANVSTLAGLLGTIFGLQKSFGSLAMETASKKATLLATGIAQAMNTTAFGLMVAIPCMVAYSILANKQARLTEDVDAAVVKLLNYIEIEKGGKK